MVMNKGLQENRLKRMAGESADYLDETDIDSTLSLPENIEKQRMAPRIVKIENTRPRVVGARNLSRMEIEEGKRWEKEVATGELVPNQAEAFQLRKADLKRREVELKQRDLERTQSDKEFREHVTQSRPARLLGNAGFLLNRLVSSAGSSMGPAFSGLGRGFVGFFGMPRAGGRRVNPFGQNQVRQNPFSMRRQSETEYEYVKAGRTIVARPIRRPVEQSGFGPNIFGHAAGGSGMSFGPGLFGGSFAKKKGKPGFGSGFFG